MEPISLPPVPGEREIRELTTDEVQSVSHVFTENGAVLPDLRQATFIGAVQDGKVLGFIVLQQKLHAEPMWIAPGESLLFAPIIREAERVILKKVGPQWCYLFAPAGRVAQMAASMGMQPEPYVIMSKLIMPEVPGRPVSFIGNGDEDIPFDLRELKSASEVTQ